MPSGKGRRRDAVFPLEAPGKVREGFEAHLQVNLGGLFLFLGEFGIGFFEPRRKNPLCGSGAELLHEIPSKGGNASPGKFGEPGDGNVMHVVPGHEFPQIDLGRFIEVEQPAVKFRVYLG